MMAHRYQLSNIINTDFLSLKYRFGNCAVQRCLELEAASVMIVEERRKIVSCMRYVQTVFHRLPHSFNCVFVEDGLLILH